MKIFFYIMLGMLLLGCEKELNLYKTPYNKKLVLNSFIAKDSLIGGNLGQSVGLLAVPNLNSLTGTMNVLLKRNGFILYNDVVILDSGKFTLPYIAKANSEYEIQIVYSDFPTIRAIDSVPASAIDVEIDTIIDQSLTYKIRFRLSDPIGANRYFLQLTSKGKQLVNNDSIETEIAAAFTASDKVFVSNIRTVTLDNSYTIFDDVLFDGQNRYLELMVAKDQFTQKDFTPKKIILRLDQISENLYFYYKSVLENTHIYGGPLASNSVQYSNIEQGLGIFSFYTTAVRQVTIR